jgi:hypothetical protein
MLKSWTKILPFFFIEWYIKKYGQLFSLYENGKDREYNAPYPYVRFLKHNSVSKGDTHEE